MAGVAIRVLVLTLLTFKKVKLIFGHPVVVKVKHTRNGLNATNDVINSKGYKILARINYTRNGLNATNDVNTSKGYEILVRVNYTHNESNTAAKDLKNSKGYKMLVRIKYIRNGLNTTTKDLKNTKRPHLMKRCQKTQNVLLAAKTVSKTQKASRCETVKSPLGGASQRNGVENPKGLSLRNVSSVRPLLSSI